MDMTFNDTRIGFDSNNHTSSVITAVCLTVISILDLAGNLLVLVAISINRNLRSLSDLFVANLAVADLCQAGVGIPLRVANFLRSEHEPIIPCQVVVLFSILFGGASNVNMLLVGADKFIAIKWPFKYTSWATVKLFICTITFSWLSLFLFAVSPLVGWGKAKNVHSSQVCRFTTTLEKGEMTAIYIFIHGIPLTTIIIIYFFILKETFRHSRVIAAQEFSLRRNNSPINDPSLTNEEMSTNGDEQRQKHRGNLTSRMRARTSNRRRRGVRMVAVLVGMFIILVLPIILIDVVEIWRKKLAPTVVINVAICLIYANSGVNVFIYAGWNSEYRRTFRLVLTSLWKFIIGPCS